MPTIKNIGIHHAGGLGNDNFASTQNLTIESIDKGHQTRWPTFPSRLKNPKTGKSWFVGYNLVIIANGDLIQTRPLGAETAAQVGHNFDTVSICVVGNFMKKANGQPVDVMTPAQLNTLTNLLKKLVAPKWDNLGLVLEPGCTFDLNSQRIYPHRILQPNHTDCNGTYYPDDWGRKLSMLPDAVVPAPTPAPLPTDKPIATPEDVSNLLSYYAQIQLLWMKIQDIFAKKRFAAQALGASPYDRGCDGNVQLTEE